MSRATTFGGEAEAEACLHLPHFPPRAHEIGGGGGDDDDVVDDDSVASAAAMSETRKRK